MAGLIETIQSVKDTFAVSTSEISSESQLFALGSVTFHGFEVPEALHILGKQTLGVNEYIGGGRSVQSFGGQLGDIRWQGVIIPRGPFRSAQSGDLYPDSLVPIDAALKIDLMRSKGDAIELIFGPLTWVVVISEFDWDISHINEISYSITVTPIEYLGITHGRSEDVAAAKRGASQLIRLQFLVSTVAALFETLQTAEIYAVLAAEDAAIIKAGEASMTNLAILITANAIFPELGAIDLANNVSHYAALIEAIADAF